MSDTGKQSPLGINSMNSLLLNEGLRINPVVSDLAGIAEGPPEMILTAPLTGYTFGKICSETVIRMITYAINRAFHGTLDGRPSASVYNALITIGGRNATTQISSITSTLLDFTVTYTSTLVPITVGTYITINGCTPAGYNSTWIVDEVGTNFFRVKTSANYGSTTVNGNFTYSIQIPALGNTKPFPYTWEQLNGPYSVRVGFEEEGWGGSLWKAWNHSTQWGWIRLLALQAWCEFNYNDTLLLDGEYRDFLGSFLQSYGFIEYSNNAILSDVFSRNFQEGTYTNMDDMMSADISGVNKATLDFGNDLIALGKSVNLQKINSFGVPSNLLATLKENNALTKNVVLTLVAAGFDASDLENIISGKLVLTREQERIIYAAFCLVVGDSLKEVLIPLNCKTVGLTSLADLLNPLKMFPNSARSLTVPRYNPNSTTAKDYIFIYTGNPLAVNEAQLRAFSNTNQLTSDKFQVRAFGEPAEGERTTTPDSSVTSKYQGYGAYCKGMIPDQISLAAGAFSSSMSQIRNIENVTFEKFSQIVRNLESTSNLTGINGSTVQVPNLLNRSAPPRTVLVPISTELRNRALPKIALGSGPSGSYTMSDFFGCMSGLPYIENYRTILDLLKFLGTGFLSLNYNQTYLAVSWEHAEALTICSNEYEETSPGSGVWNVYTNVVGAQIRVLSNGYAMRGGGYGREGAPSPTGYEPTTGATFITTIGQDPSNIGTYGKVLSITVSNPGARTLIATVTSATQPAVAAPRLAIEVQCPPVSPGTRSFTGGSNSPFGTQGWPQMDGPTTNYIGFANQEIDSIAQSASRTQIDRLNSAWNATGTQLLIEQRARSIGLRPKLVSPRDTELNLFPLIQYSFTDTLPSFATRTEPHMYSKTIEAIVDLRKAGGNSMVGSLRENRNQPRLAELGIPLDNNVPSALPLPELINYISNNIAPGVVNTNVRVNQTFTEFTTNTVTPSTLVQVDAADNIFEASPLGEYDPVTQTYYTFNPGTLPGGDGGGGPGGGGGGTTPGPGGGGGGYPPTPVDNGQPTDPGSWAGNPYPGIVPPYLNIYYISRNILPSYYTVSQAIDEVTRCNCDCWELL